MKAIKSALAGVKDSVGSFKLPELPSLGRKVDMPVYMIHNSKDPEDYFFIFDFEEFVERSREGVFVRPKIKLWAGRDDFDRARFAGQFRESFAAEFDAARQALAQQDDGKGWFSWLNDLRKDVVGGDFTAFVANVILLIGLNAGRMVLSQILPTGLFTGKSQERKLEQSIEGTKAKVDTALEGLELVLHRELYVHPYDGAAPAHLADADFDEWPLPAYVRAHLADRTSGAFW